MKIVYDYETMRSAQEVMEQYTVPYVDERGYRKFKKMYKPVIRDVKEIVYLVEGYPFMNEAELFKTFGKRVARKLLREYKKNG